MNPSDESGVYRRALISLHVIREVQYSTIFNLSHHLISIFVFVLDFSWYVLRYTILYSKILPNQSCRPHRLEKLLLLECALGFIRSSDNNDDPVRASTDLVNPAIS